MYTLHMHGTTVYMYIGKVCYLFMCISCMVISVAILCNIDLILVHNISNYIYCMHNVTIQYYVNMYVQYCTFTDRCCKYIVIVHLCIYIHLICLVIYMCIQCILI